METDPATRVRALAQSMEANGMIAEAQVLYTLSGAIGMGTTEELARLCVGFAVQQRARHRAPENPTGEDT